MMVHCGAFVDFLAGGWVFVLSLTVTFKIETSTFRKLGLALNSALKLEITARTCVYIHISMRRHVCIDMYGILL